MYLQIHNYHFKPIHATSKIAISTPKTQAHVALYPREVNSVHKPVVNRPSAIVTAASAAQLAYRASALVVPRDAAARPEATANTPILTVPKTKNFTVSMESFSKLYIATEAGKDPPNIGPSTAAYLLACKKKNIKHHAKYNY
jgi:hypothetical protein